ncbi:hypothetical protein YC2023_093977 [Brassica napus]
MAWREDTSTSDIQIWSFLARNHSFGFRRVRRHPNRLGSACWRIPKKVDGGRVKRRLKGSGCQICTGKGSIAASLSSLARLRVLNPANNFSGEIPHGDLLNLK